MNTRRDEILATLRSWIDTLKARDVNGHLVHYNDRLHTYYLKRNATKNQVRLDRERALSHYSSLDISLKNIQIELDPTLTRAVATFDKTWNFTGTYPSSGEVRERVWLDYADRRWLITGERDLKLHWQKQDFRWP
ncbi:MAG TPA: hypothetical protein VGQ81_06620 [Acidobacteriota bacterium]|nr:hypothetical protein [Acidobacteriota bacterium]